MRITRIDFEGKPGHHAVAQRMAGRDGRHIVAVSILTPEEPNGRDMTAAGDDEQAVWSLAVHLQRRLDGHEGTNSMIHDYYRELQRFAD